ncbi:MAG: hypothetical protein QY332_21450 [Anaerolineales bacterium]|nr:MAG: hypothetical protein QY332_21450 [Anaerolineales bacterium]HMR99347.1 hypothetical protein [Anaerolineales bacterium]
MQNRMFQFLAACLSIFLLLALPLQSVLADGEGEGIEKEVNGYHVRLVLVDAPKIGENAFHIQITDAMGMPVTNAEVMIMAAPYEDMSEHEEDSNEESHDTDSMSGMDMPEAEPTEEEASSMPGMDMPEEEPTDEANADSHGESQDSHGSEDEHGETAIQEIVLEAGHEAGEYEGSISLNRSGDWTFHVQFTVDGQLNEVEMPVAVAGIDAKYGILAGFFGINATVISAAAISKRRSIAQKA